MSWREHYEEVRSSVEPGEVITICRDNDTRSYRLFVNAGWADAPRGGHQIKDCLSCELSIEDLRQLSGILESAISAHKPWPDPNQGS